MAAGRRSSARLFQTFRLDTSAKMIAARSSFVGKAVVSKASVAKVSPPLLTCVAPMRLFLFKNHIGRNRTDQLAAGAPPVALPRGVVVIPTPVACAARKPVGLAQTGLL